MTPPTHTISPLSQNSETRRHPANATDQSRDGENALFLKEVLHGLTKTRKSLPCKYLYDAEGSRLFDMICDLPEYYPTRTELAIFRACLPEMAERVGPSVQVVEYGSGSGLKTRLLLSALHEPAGCILVEISRGHLMASAKLLASDFPHIPIEPLCADYTTPLDLLQPPTGTRRRVAFFPGSTIGNFTPQGARQFLRSVSATVGAGGGLIIGVDLQKAPQILERAYDDEAGVTAAFNLNVLARINRELDGNFPLDQFQHVAFYNQKECCIEMHLMARWPVVANIAGKSIRFARGESIHTESSYKHTLDGFAAMAGDSGWRVEQVWTDPAGLFSVQYLTVS